MTTPPEDLEALLASFSQEKEEIISENDDDLSDIFVQATTAEPRSFIGAGLITIHPNGTHPSWLEPNTYFPNADDILEIWCAKFEIGGKENKLHAHIFFKFINTKRMRFQLLLDSINKVLGKGCDIKKCRSATKKSIQCAVNYVLKKETSAPDCEPFIWNASCAFDQKVWDERAKKPSVKQQIIDHIETKPIWWNWDQIVQETPESKILLCDCSWGKKFHDGRAATIPARKIENVVILYGAAGTGKTTMAVNWDTQENEDFQLRYYRRNPGDGHFWGGGRLGYRGQRVIHFDEFTGQEKFNELKEWTNIGHFGPCVPIKNSAAQLNHDTVVFTSNTHPAGWYRKYWTDDPKQFDAFHRRVTKVLFFPEKRPDGTFNEPTADEPAYFIDQTHEWIGFKRSYERALNHAEANWPLKDFDEGDAYAPGFTLPPKRKIDDITNYFHYGKFPKNK